MIIGTIYVTTVEVTVNHLDAPLQGCCADRYYSASLAGTTLQRWGSTQREAVTNLLNSMEEEAERERQQQ